MQDYPDQPVASIDRFLETYLEKSLKDSIELPDKTRTAQQIQLYIELNWIELNLFQQQQQHDEITHQCSKYCNIHSLV